MKWLPTLLVILAFLVLLWISQMQPSSESGGGQDTTQVEAATGPTAGGTTASLAPAITTTQDTAPAQPVAKPGSIHGVVRSGDQGIPGIEVTLVDANGNAVGTTRSGADGRYQFSGKSPGQYQVQATDPSFLYSHSSTPRVQLTAGGTGEANLTMTRGDGSIVGHVRDSLVDGVSNPLVAKLVRVRSLDVEDMEVTVLTDPRGEFRVGGLAKGRFSVSVPDLERETTVVIQGVEPVEAAFDVVLPASLEIKLGEVYLHSKSFTGDETITIQPTAETVENYVKATTGDEEFDKRQVTASLARTHKVDEDGQVSFADIFPGSWTVQAVYPPQPDDNVGAPIEDPITLTLGEASAYKQVLPLANAVQGSGTKVPMLVKVILFLFFGALFVLPVLVFPAPLSGRKPADA